MLPFTKMNQAKRPNFIASSRVIVLAISVSPVCVSYALNIAIPRALSITILHSWELFLLVPPILPRTFPIAFLAFVYLPARLFRLCWQYRDDVSAVKNRREKPFSALFLSHGQFGFNLRRGNHFPHCIIFQASRSTMSLSDDPRVSVDTHIARFKNALAEPNYRMWRNPYFI
jgi:hypothetical protein